MTTQMAFDLEAALADVDHQRALDAVGADQNGNPGRLGSARTPSLDYVRVRMRAVLEAAAEPGEEFAYRQSLVDLAAVSTELAATLPRPDVQESAAP